MTSSDASTGPGERAVGHVTHYFGKLGVAAVVLTETLRVGDRVHIVGHTTDETMTVDRMQIDHQDVQVANPGDDVALHVTAKVREHDEVRKAT
jgi:putative protease